MFLKIKNFLIAPSLSFSGRKSGYGHDYKYKPILRAQAAQYLLGPLGLMRAQLWATETYAYGQQCLTV